MFFRGDFNKTSRSYELCKYSFEMKGYCHVGFCYALFVPCIYELLKE